MDESLDSQRFDFDLRTNAGDVPDDWFDLQGLVSEGPGTEVTDRPGSKLI